MTCSPFLDLCLARTPPEDSCRKIRDACDLVVQASVEVLEPFFCPGSRCDTVKGVVTHGPPIVSTYSLVAAWPERIAPMQRSNPQIGMPKMLGASVGCQVWIDTWPVAEVEGERVIQPDPDLVTEAALLSAIIGESWYLGIVELIRQNAAACDGWEMEPLAPLGPNGTFVGWETGFSFLV